MIFSFDLETLIADRLGANLTMTSLIKVDDLAAAR
jgi:hypothetical protein